MVKSLNKTYKTFSIEFPRNTLLPNEDKSLLSRYLKIREWELINRQSNVMERFLVKLHAKRLPWKVICFDQIYVTHRNCIYWPRSIESEKSYLTDIWYVTLFMAQKHWIWSETKLLLQVLKIRKSRYSSIF
jgi:hypothetical protein